MSVSKYKTYDEFVSYMLEKYNCYGDEFIEFLETEKKNISKYITDEQKISYLKIYIDMWIFEKENDIRY
jgi:hypothetical protein